MDERTPMQSPNRAAAATQRETELLLLLREAVQRLEQGPTFNEKTEEKGTLIREIQDLKDMLEVKERKVNDLQNGMENLQEQLRDKEKQMGSLKGRIKSLQADTSNKDSALTRTMLEKIKVEHKMALEETAARHEAQSMNWLWEREALKAQLLAQPRRRIRKVERRDRIRQFQEREDREHLIRKRNWLEVEKRRLDADCMELQFLERERQRIRFERRRERYGIQRERVELRRQQEQLRFGQDYRSGKRSYRFQGGNWPGRANANTLSSHDPGGWSVRGAPSLHQRVEECGNPSRAQRPWRPRGQVVEAVYHRFSRDGAKPSKRRKHTPPQDFTKIARMARDMSDKEILKMELEQLKKEVDTPRTAVGVNCAETIAYVESHIAEDMLIKGVPDDKNPYKGDKGGCIIT
ncbi:unnamed protein product [Gadus morhua 'NCC']